jgi:transcriptional regulator with XRE-family HTH domain
MKRDMEKEHLLARLLRAVSGDSQEEMAEGIGVHPSQIARFELGERTPSREHLGAMARRAGLTLRDAEDALRHVESLRRRHRRVGTSVDDQVDSLTENLRAIVQTALERFRTLPLPNRPPRAEDREEVQELWRQFVGLTPGERTTVARLAPEFHVWALCERACAASAEAVTRDPEEAAALAQIALEIADRVRGEPGWRSRLRAYAEAHAALALRAAGDLEAAEALLAQAKWLWHSGTDPEGLLDPGGLFEPEGREPGAR